MGGDHPPWVLTLDAQPHLCVAGHDPLGALEELPHLVGVKEDAGTERGGRVRGV